MSNLNVDFSALLNSNNSESKNFDYTSLYSFLAKKTNKDMLTTVEKKNIRKTLQNSTPSELKNNSLFMSAIVQSGFLEANKNKAKFKPYLKLFVPVKK